MPPNANAPTWDRGAAENSAENMGTRCKTQFSPGLPENQVLTIAQRNERVLRQAHLLAVDIDMIEGTQTSKLLRTLAFRAWRQVYVATP